MRARRSPRCSTPLDRAHVADDSGEHRAFRLVPARVLARAPAARQAARSRRFGNSRGRLRDLCAGLGAGKSLSFAAKADEQDAVRQSMQGPRIATASFGRALLLVAALAGCALPRSGPTAGRDHARRQRPDARHAPRRRHPADRRGRHARSEVLGFGAGFVNAGALSPDTIRPGDTLSVGVWENVDTGLLAGVGQKATTLEAIQVDQSGDIFVPYAGRLAGRRAHPRRASPRDHREPRRHRPPTRRSRSAASPATAPPSASWAGSATPGVYPDRGADPAALGDAGQRRRRGAGARRGADQDRARRPDRADLAAGSLRQPALRRGAARRRPDHRRGGPPLLHRARRHHRPVAGRRSTSATCR